MEFIKKHVIFVVLIAIGVIAFLVFGFLYWTSHQQLSELEKSNQTAHQRIDSLRGRQGIAPTQENSASMEAYSQALDEHYQSLVDQVLNKELTSRLFANPPRDNERFAIDHLGYREQLRRLATERAEDPIRLATGVNDFGFAEYAGVAPNSKLVGPLFKQRRIIDFLLRELFKAGPSVLIAVNRGPVDGEIVRTEDVGSSSRGSGRATQLPKDVFLIPEQISARVPGIVDTIPIQIVFEGKTPALRNFLNQLVDSKLPIVVRNVEVRSVVAPVAAAGSNTLRSRRAAVAAQAAAEKMPEGLHEVIADNRSIFTVTLEFLVPSEEKSSAQGE